MPRCACLQMLFGGPPLLQGACPLPSHGDDFSKLQASAVKTAVAVWPITLSPFLPPDNLMVCSRPAPALIRNSTGGHALSGGPMLLDRTCSRRQPGVSVMLLEAESALPFTWSTWSRILLYRLKGQRAEPQVRLEGLVLAPACGGDLPRSVVEHFGAKWTATLPIVVALQVNPQLWHCPARRGPWD